MMDLLKAIDFMMLLLTWAPIQVGKWGDMAPRPHLRWRPWFNIYVYLKRKHSQWALTI